MNPPTTLTNHNPPATTGCCLKPNPIRREESDTPHLEPRRRPPNDVTTPITDMDNPNRSVEPDKRPSRARPRVCAGAVDPAGNAPRRPRPHHEATRRVRRGHVSLFPRRSVATAPQHVTVRSLRKAHETEPPAATAM